jgi:hypothetical protein
MPETHGLTIDQDTNQQQIHADEDEVAKMFEILVGEPGKNDTQHDRNSTIHEVAF